jgi:hypothetical protein
MNEPASSTDESFKKKIACLKIRILLQRRYARRGGGGVFIGIADKVVAN